MPIVNVNSCNIFYETAGSGEPIVFLHGESHSSRLFEKQLEYFGRNYRCIVYDRRGHAQSDVPEYGYSVWNQIGDMRLLFDALGIERATIVAVAMSTPIAVSFALRHPERVKALVLSSWYELDGFPLLEQRRKSHQLSFAELHLKFRDVLVNAGKDGLIRFVEENYETLLPILPLDKPLVRGQLIEILAGHAVEHYTKAGEYYTSIPFLREELRRITCPVLGICGTEDPSPDRPELLEGMPNFRQEWIPGARRFTMMEYPDLFNEVLEAFLVENAPSATDQRVNNRVESGPARV